MAVTGVVAWLERGTSPVLRTNLIRLAGVDVSVIATRPWDLDLMAPFGPPCPHWYGSIPRLLFG